MMWQAGHPDRPPPPRSQLPPTPTVCLVMIVKDEEAVVGRAIASCWDAVDCWVVVDTGSTDRTEDVVLAATAGKPGLFARRPWVGFGANRTEALSLARQQHPGARWLFMMDADDSLVLPADGPRRLLLGAASTEAEPAAYNVPMRKNEVRYVRAALTRADLPWTYVGKLHEVPHLAGGERMVPALPTPGVFVEARTEGARSRNPHKYRDDALVLEAELRSGAPEGGYARTLFYCAQCWRDAGVVPRAVELYKQVAANAASQWSEERYVACLNVVGMDPDWDQVFRHAWLALELNPRRREATYACLSRHRRSGLKPTRELVALAAHTDATAAAADALDPAWLFVDAEAYGWRYADEAAVAACNLGCPSSLPFAKTQAERCLSGPEGRSTPRLLENLHAIHNLMATAAMARAGPAAAPAAAPPPSGGAGAAPTPAP